MGHLKFLAPRRTVLAILTLQLPPYSVSNCRAITMR